MQIINIQESDYDFLVTVKSELNEHLELKDIPCNALLPKETTGEIILQLFFSKDQYEHSGLNKVWHISVNGERKEEGLTYQKIIAERIIPSTKQIHNDLFVITGEPRNLYIENHYSDSPITVSANNDESFRPVVEFQLTPSKILTPIRSMPDDDKYLWQASIELCDGNTIVFDDIKHTFRDGKAGWTTKKSLVARCETLENGSREEIQRVSDLLDDVLLLASFGEGQRCVSLGWNSYTKQMQSYYFRRDKTIPEPLKDFWLNKIIEPEETFIEFLKTAYGNFCSSEFQPNIRRAINSYLTRRETAESEFISLYGGLESLVLSFRRSKNLEFIFSTEDDWKDFEKEILNWIKKESSLKNDSTRRSLIYGNIKGLQRQSFGSALKEMLRFYNIENEFNDLWNITGDRDGWSISTIRNKLVHGETFIEPSKYKHFTKAAYHLRWTLARIILAILGWNIERSDVSNTNLEGMQGIIYNNWEESKKLLSS